MSATTLTFSASGSDPDGDALTYNWQFGDGGSATGQTATHIYQRAGTFTVAMTVTDGRGGSGSASTTVTARSLTGLWKSEARGWNYELEQSGGTLGGRVLGFRNVIYSPDPALTIRGTVKPPNVIDFGAEAFSLGFTGKADSTLNSLSGTTYDCVSNCRNYGEMIVRQ